MNAALLPFHFAFAVGLAKYFWDTHKSSMIFGVLSALLLPKETKSELSKAERTGAKTIQFQYIYRGATYEMVLPIRSKPLGWEKCIADISTSDGYVQVQDVTEMVTRKAGISRDFYGVKLHAGQIVRGAKELRFVRADGTVLLAI